MTTESLAESIVDLSLQEQESVLRFIAQLKQQRLARPEVSFTDAAEEFMSQHPDLLRRLGH
ncbi:MAG: hypothetical protein FJW31_10220 [Acidobacteria bacterium]|nr:hypothetical protein [Acidobacteriota bacterium]